MKNQLRQSILILTFAIIGCGNNAKAQTIAAGFAHSIKVCTDGTVQATGSNDYGALGNGTNTNSNVPVQTNNLTNIIAVGAGYQHSVALKNDGTVWCFGQNNFGQLGIGNNTNSNVPIMVNGLVGITAISTGRDFTLALKNDGTVWAWGYDGYGQLGTGNIPIPNISQSNIPVQVIGLTGVKAIAAGFFHSIALKNDGTLWTWGKNQFGQLGNGNNNDSSIPILISSLTGITSIAGGSNNTLVLKSDGTVWNCGLGTDGQLGNALNNNSNVPVQVSALTNIISIGRGGFHNLAVKSDGTAWAWGSNQSGQLGNGTYTNSNVPVQVSGLAGIIEVAGEQYHSLALKNDGTIWAWGTGTTGALGLGLNTGTNIPLLMEGCAGITSPSACINWDLMGSTAVTSTIGNVGGQPENISPGTAAPLISVYLPYSGGQRLWTGTTGWVAGPLDINRYIEFNAAPLPGNNFTVTNVSFNYGDNPLSTDFNIINFQAYYSTDNWNTSTILNSSALIYLNTTMSAFNASLNATVSSGSTFSLRIFPFAIQNGIAMTPTFAIHNHVSICGTTSTLALNIKDIKKEGNGFRIYPNPASNLMHVQYDNITNKPVISIYNMMGQNLLNIQAESTDSVIDVSSLTNGIYFVQLIDPQNNIIENMKIVIQ